MSVVRHVRKGSLSPLNRRPQVGSGLSPAFSGGYAVAVPDESNSVLSIKKGQVPLAHQSYGRLVPKTIAIPQRKGRRKRGWLGWFEKTTSIGNSWVLARRWQCRA